MIELRIRPMEADAEGWVEVCLISQPVGGSDDGSEGVTVGHIREVETGGPHAWWDARTIDGDGMQVRRFVGVEPALLALAGRVHLSSDQRKLVGW